MAQVPYNEGVPDVNPASAPDTTQRIQTNPAQFGGAVAQGLEKLGAGALQAGKVFGQVAADDTWNNTQDRITKILHGDPDQTVIGPEGTPQPDVGFLGRKGRAALDAWPGVQRQIDDVIKEGRGKLTTTEQQLQFDQISRRYRSYVAGQIGTHADREANVWYANVNNSTANLAKQHIAANAENPEAVAAGAADLRSAKVKDAQLKGGGNEMIASAVAEADREALETQVQAIGVRDPVRALSILEKNRNIAGSSYATLYNQFKSGAAQVTGREIADEETGHAVRAEPVAKVDAPYIAAIKTSEGYSPTARWDVKQNTVGYGTRALSAGETITREEADKRFNTEITKAANFVDTVNPNLDAGTRAALTSLTFNAGTTWATSGLGEAIKKGDLNTARDLFMKYNQAGGELNPGLAARRYREAQWFGQGRPETDTLPLVDKNVAYERVLDRTNDNPLEQSAALSRVNQIYSVYQSQEVSRNAAFDQRRKDTLAESQAAGNVVEPLSEPEFVQRYKNVDQGIAEYRNYVGEIQYHADVHTLDGMSSDEQASFIERQRPTAGQSGFANQQVRFDKLQAAAGAINKQRNDDPALAVSRDLAVREATAGMDPKQPSAMQKLAAVRLAAQERLGIDEDSRSPITKAEALRLTVPLRRMLPGQEREVLSDLADQFQETFGPYADQAFEYAIKANKLSAEASQTAARVVKKLGLGETPTRTDIQGADRSNEVDAAVAALKAISPRPGVMGGAAERYATASGPEIMARGTSSLRERQMGQTEPESKSVGEAAKPEPARVPDARDIVALRSNPRLSDRFDQKYGPGKAKRILETYPVGVPADGR